MNTLAISRQISELLVPAGIVGAGLAVVSVLITCVVVLISKENIGIPIGGWIIGTLLSVAAGFSELLPLVVSVASGIVMIVFILVVLGMRRGEVRTTRT